LRLSVLFNLRIKCSRNILCEYINNIKVSPFTPKTGQTEQNKGHEIGKEGVIIFDKKDFQYKKETIISYSIYL